MGGGRSGGGVERVNSEKAREQLAARKETIKDSRLSKTPGVGGVLSQAMGEFSIAQQEKSLEEGGYAVAVPGTSFAPQGQAYTEAPGMKSSRKLGSQRFAVGTTGKKDQKRTIQNPYLLMLASVFFILCWDLIEKICSIFNISAEK